MKKLSVLLITTLITTFFCSAPIVYSEKIYDDAVLLNPDNPNIADSSNVTVQNWGSFSDDTFFGMQSGDTEGNTFVTIQSSYGEDIENFKAVTYIHQDITSRFTFYTASELEGVYSPLPEMTPSSQAEGQAGFGRYEYAYTDIPSGTKYIKILFPSDDQNWRLMVPSFEINTMQDTDPENPTDPEDPPEETVIQVDGTAMADGKYVHSMVNIKYSDWETGSVYGDGGYYEPQKAPGDMDSYIIFKAPNDGFFSSFNISGVKMTDKSFSLYACESEDGEYYALTTSVSELSGVKDGWNGQLYTASEIPAETKFVKAVFPASSDSWSVLLAGFGFEWTTESQGGSGDTEGFVEDDATAISGNPNIADSNNTEPQTWGDFQDITFFAMKSADTQGNTYITVTAPNNAYMSDITVTTYKYADITQDFVLEASERSDGDFTPVKADLTTQPSTHDNFNICTYSVPELPLGTKFVKIKFPPEDENWTLLIAGFSFNWTTEQEEEEEKEEYSGTTEDDASLKDENGLPAADCIYESNAVVVGDMSEEGVDDITAYRGESFGVPYIIIKAPNSAYLKNLTVNAMFKDNPAYDSADFEFMSGNTLSGDFAPISASYRPFDTGSENWDGKMYIISQLPPGCKFVKITWPAEFEDISDFALGSYKFEWSIDSGFTLPEEISVKTAAFVKNGNIGEESVSVLCEALPVSDKLPDVNAKFILAVYSGKRLTYVETREAELSSDKTSVVFDNIGKSGDDRIKIMIIDNTDAVKQLAEPVELY